MEKLLFEKHENYKEKFLTYRRFKHNEIVSLIESHAFEKSIIGYSFENRSIHKIKIGSGKRQILLWSQMHGNEATATMAFFDIFNFFKSSNDGFDDYRNAILAENSLHFIPVLNPDGAELFTRQTSQGIDMNRDALALQCPESKLLKSVLMEIKPEFSFNLHDQCTRYSAGLTNKQATLSFLATAYNEQREWNEVRIKSRQVINKMNELIQSFIPAGVGRFSDEFEPRAFGDNIQKWGSSLILIESGGYPNDPEKQYIRKLNFVAILGALFSISKKTYTNYTLADYEAIPKNEKTLFDLKISNLKICELNQTYNCDLGINFEEITLENSTDFKEVSVIEDLGDLSVFWGINELDAKGGMMKSFDEFPELKQKYNVSNSKLPKIGQEATFVIQNDASMILIINGKIIL